MKQILASLGFGVLLFVAWCCIIVFTSQDFAHEGPNSVWYAPIGWWGGVIRQSGFLRGLPALGSTISLVLGFSVLAAPFYYAIFIHLIRRAAAFSQDAEAGSNCFVNVRPNKSSEMMA